MYLSHFNDPEMVPYLLKCVKTKQPDEALVACYEGLATFCTGENMKQAISMFRSANEDIARQGYMILYHIETEFQLEELEALVNPARNADEEFDLAIIVGKITSRISKRKRRP